MKAIFLYSPVLSIIVLLASCSSPDADNKNVVFKIDSTMRWKAIQEIRKNEDSGRCNCSSKHNAMFYTNDSLVEEIIDQSPDMFFYTNYRWHNDTLSIAAIGGWLTSGGFIADIYQGKMVKAYYGVCAHESNVYKVKTSDTLSRCVDVPLCACEFVISDIPQKDKEAEIFCFVSFSTSNYYTINNPRSKFRCSSSFYFKATDWELRKKHKTH